MRGALIGDCIGNFWEFSGNKDPAIPLWVPASRFTDDSVCTGAIAKWLLSKNDTNEVQHLTTTLHDLARQHMGRGFAQRMLLWVMSDNPTPYGSWGNGSAMRVSPVALWADTEEELLRLAKVSAEVTHNNHKAVNGAQATAWAIRYALEEKNGPKLLQEVDRMFGYETVALDPEQVRPDHIFDVSCQGTVPLALAIAVKSGSFDEAMRWCCASGGDADTLAAIAGPVCEMLYGIPEQHIHNARLRFHDEDNIWNEVEAIYQHPKVQQLLKKHKYALLPATGSNIAPLRYKFL